MMKNLKKKVKRIGKKKIVNSIYKLYIFGLYHHHFGYNYFHLRLKFTQALCCIEPSGALCAFISTRR